MKNVTSSQCFDTCQVPADDILFCEYHNTEWGVPTCLDQDFFEKICLEGFQVGLSWQTILHKRSNLRRAFSSFCPLTLVEYSEADVQRLLQDKGIIRNERKIRSVINNAHRFVEFQNKGQSLAALCWSHEPHSCSRPVSITSSWLDQNPHSKESCALSSSLKKLGWSFIGPTNMYAMMQAMGIVNDHVEACPRKMEIDQLRDAFSRPS